jgi:hypothetical protein
MGEEAGMDLWNMLGVTRETALLLAAGCFGAAIILAGAIMLRRRRPQQRGLDLSDP